MAGACFQRREFYMNTTRSESDEVRGQMDEREKGSIQKEGVRRPDQEAEKPEKYAYQGSSKTGLERREENSAMTGKEAPDQSGEQKKESAYGSAAIPGTASNEMSALTRPDAVPGEKAAENPVRPFIPPRKNVIPPRPFLFENGSRAPFAELKNAWPANEARDAANLPTGVIPSMTNQGVPGNAQLEGQKWLADEPTSELPAQRVSPPPQVPATWRERLVREQGRAATLENRNTPLPGGSLSTAQASVVELPTTPLPSMPPAQSPNDQKGWLTRGRAFFLALLLAILVINATVTGFGQFFGPQGWGSVFTGPASSGQNLLNQLQQQLRQHTPTPGATGQPTTAPLTPTQIVNSLMANMTLDQKLGQMLMVRFDGTSYTQQLSAMITQYHVGSVIEYQSNIVSKSQLIALNTQIQHGGDLPMIVAIDQEGGTVDRLVNLDGAQPSATSIGATGNPNMAYQQGLKDAQALASYGFNLNLAPVVDVNNVYNAQLYERTYGNNPTIVSEMAGAYLRGLQQSGKILGTIKHFPGMGDVSVDPHGDIVPDLTRSLAQLNAIDWAPYKKLISQGNVYSVMVTHEFVNALDTNTPSSLSPAVINVLRNQLGFQGVIITDGLTMGSIISRYTLGQAAVMAVKAGDDLLMDPGSPDEVAQMVDALKQAISSGTISQQRIDDSVRRILLLKYQMGLLHIH